MYLVVSKWECLAGHEAEFRRNAVVMRNLLKKQPEVKLLESIATDGGGSVVVMGYRDEASYKSLIEDPKGVFAKALAEHKLEDHGRWLWSERGEAQRD